MGLRNLYIYQEVENNKKKKPTTYDGNILDTKIKCVFMKEGRG